MECKLASQYYRDIFRNFNLLLKRFPQLLNQINRARYFHKVDIPSLRNDFQSLSELAFNLSGIVFIFRTVALALEIMRPNRSRETFRNRLATRAGNSDCGP